MRWSALAVPILVSAACPPRAEADRVTGFNEDVRFLAPATVANDLEIVVPGNRTFANFRYGFSGPGNGVTTTYNSVANTTTLTFFGQTITPNTITPPNTKPGELHFGYTLNNTSTNGHGFGPADTLAKVWTYNNAVVETATPGFTVSVVPNGPQNAPVRYLVAFSSAIPVGGAVGQLVSDWAAIPYFSNTPPQVIFSNSSNMDMQIYQDSYLMLTPGTGGLPLESDPTFGDTLLGMLDNQHLPPTDPRFVSLGIPDGTIVPAGATVPEPSSLALIGLGALGLLAGIRDRRAKVRSREPAPATGPIRG